MNKLRWFLLGLLFTAAQASNAITIDFQGPAFSVGDGIAAVNAVTTPLGATFDVGTQSQQFNQFDVAVDPNNPANQIIDTGTHPDEADVLVNFSAPVDFVQVTYVDNPDNLDPIFVVIVAYDSIGTAENFGALSFVASDNGFEPTLLSISAPGIRSLQIESSSGRLLFDDVVFQFQSQVPEPTTLLLMGLGLAGLGFARKRLH